MHPKEMRAQCISLAGWKLEEGFAEGVSMCRVLRNAKHGLLNKAEQSCSTGVRHYPNQARRNTASSVLM